MSPFYNLKKSVNFIDGMTKTVNPGEYFIIYIPQHKHTLEHLCTNEFPLPVQMINLGWSIVYIDKSQVIISK